MIRFTGGEPPRRRRRRSGAPPAGGPGAPSSANTSQEDPGLKQKTVQLQDLRPEELAQIRLVARYGRLTRTKRPSQADSFDAGGTHVSRRAAFYLIESGRLIADGGGLFAGVAPQTYRYTGGAK